MRYLILLMLLMNCATIIKIEDKSLLPYLNNFIMEAEARGVHPSTERLSIGFVDKMNTPNVVGNCALYYPSYVGVVTFLRSYFERLSEKQKLIIVYHELGHCLLHLRHVEGYHNIMESKLMNERYYNSTMLDDMFLWYQNSENQIDFSASDSECGI